MHDDADPGGSVGLLDRPRGAERTAGAIDRRTRSQRFFADPSWPIVVLLVGFPLWWLLGLSNLLPIALAIPMARQLMQRQSVRVPRGFGLWLIFLVFVVVGVAMLWVNAPGAVPGGGGSRLLVYAYRLLWYLACTVVLLWVGNLSESDLPTDKLVRLLGWMFVVTTFGGLLGVVLPRFEVTSLVEMIVPGGLRSNAFVSSLIHPRAANESKFLGRSQFRPMAPFSFANSWGANFAMFLPFFAVGWMSRRAPVRLRRLGLLVLLPAALPVVYSLNRGLWLCLALGAVYVVVRLAMSGRVGALVIALTLVIVGLAVFLASPLAALVQERLDNAHSNDRRGELLSLTVSSTFEGSPILGYGSTRDVQGSFASIAGGATPDCSACEVPPLGTQGHLWLVIFSQGLVGTVFFLGFFAVQAKNHALGRSSVEAIGLCLLLFFAFQMFVYDTLGMPLYTLMIAIGLMWRTRQQRERLHGSEHVRRTLEGLLRRLRHRIALVIVLSLLGGFVGGIIALRRPTVYNARGVVLLAPAPVYLDPTSSEDAREITVDTEAALVFAERTIAAVREEAELGAAGDDLRDRILVTAPPITEVLNIDVRDTNAARAERTVDALVSNFLAARDEFLTQRREQTIRWLEVQLEQLGPDDADDIGVDAVGDPTGSTAEEIQATIDELRTSPATGGETLRLDPARRVRATRQLDVLSGAMVGFLLAVGIAWLTGPRRRPRSWRPSRRPQRDLGARVRRRRSARSRRVGPVEVMSATS